MSNVTPKSDLHSIKVKIDENCSRSKLVQATLNINGIEDVYYPSDETAIVQCNINLLREVHDQLKSNGIQIVNSDVIALKTAEGHWKRGLMTNFVNAFDKTNDEEVVYGLMNSIGTKKEEIKIEKIKSNYVIFKTSNKLISDKLKKSESVIIRHKGYPFKIVDYPEIMVCEKCLKFGHKIDECKSKNYVCPKCKGRHLIKDCKMRNYSIRCSYCLSTKAGEVNHRVGTFNCSYLLRSLAAQNGKVLKRPITEENQTPK